GQANCFLVLSSSELLRLKVMLSRWPNPPLQFDRMRGEIRQFSERLAHAIEENTFHLSPSSACLGVYLTRPMVSVYRTPCQVVYLAFHLLTPRLQPKLIGPGVIGAFGQSASCRMPHRIHWAGAGATRCLRARSDYRARA